MNEVVTGILELEINKRRASIRNALKLGTVDIVFEKNDGTMRTMTATTSDLVINALLAEAGKELLAEDYTPQAFDENQSYQKVFDVEIAEFRGFVWHRLESAKSSIFGIL